VGVAIAFLLGLIIGCVIGWKVAVYIVKTRILPEIMDADSH
jgi:hypothetical protein